MTDEELADFERIWRNQVKPDYYLPTLNVNAWDADDTKVPGADADGLYARVFTLIEDNKRLRAEHTQLQDVANAGPLRSDLRAIVEDAVGRTAKLYEPLQYTLDRPTADGPYWLRDYLRCRSYLAQYQDDQVWILEPEDGKEPRAEPIAEFGPERWEWAGPLIEPPSER